MSDSFFSDGPRPVKARPTRRRPERTFVPDISGFLPREVIGPLNEEETRNAPEYLYLAGDRHLLRRDRLKVSIVGSRKATDEGLRRAARIAKALVNRNVIVVSGLAAGIDRAAHEAAIDAGGRTIAVIGTPLEKAYPRENANLQRVISEQHLVVSQFPKDYPVTPKNFPMRNRTMALIVDASVIVEAGESSGTLSQGWEALRLARPLFIMKSVFDRADLTWPKQMCDYGAQVLDDTQDLFEALPDGDPAALIPA